MGLKGVGGWFDCICFCYYCTWGIGRGVISILVV